MCFKVYLYLFLCIVIDYVNTQSSDTSTVTINDAFKNSSSSNCNRSDWITYLKKCNMKFAHPVVSPKKQSLKIKSSIQSPKNVKRAKHSIKDAIKKHVEVWKLQNNKWAKSRGRSRSCRRDEGIEAITAVASYIIKIIIKILYYKLIWLFRLLNYYTSIAK